jgi:hypothetical protein
MSNIRFTGRVAGVTGTGEQVMESWNRIVSMENPVFCNSLPAWSQAFWTTI